jgi:hypothetical protein
MIKVKGILTSLRNIVIEKTRDNMDWRLRVSVVKIARPSLSNKKLSSKEAKGDDRGGLLRMKG